jgi:acyl-CoA synthetase (AMP-forming)/AMP-acid ligase II
MGQCLGLVDTDRSALVFPFTHIGGITWLFSSLQFGCSLIIMEAFHPQRTPEVLSAADVSVAGSGTPFHMAYLAYQRDHDEPMFPHVRNFPGGGAPKPPQLVYDMRTVFDAPVLSGYGLTEAPILTMAAESDTDDELAASEGKPMPGVELRLVKIEGGIAAAGEEGEIRAKAPQLMKGYLDSSLDADAFDADGYFRTGDLGRLDDRGNLIITGRLKDIIIRKGENVSAKEVEDMIYTHPQVADVGVIGVPDAERGEMVCAVVQLAPGVESLTLPELSDFLRSAGLMVQKLPERLKIVELLPRNPAGKILKQNLKDQYG